MVEVTKEMTNRINALLVVLDQDIREDDVQPLVNAISMMRHVVKVTTNVVSDCITSQVEYSRANRDMRLALLRALEETKR